MHPIQTLLGLTSAPVCLTFLPSAPAGVSRVPQGALAGCGYWKLAAEGRVFYTEAADHYGCPVGAHTHGIELPPEVAQQLQGLVTMMVGLEYLDPAEVAGIPTRTEPFGVAVYAPLGQAPCPPDVVLVRGNARQIMLLTEAARAAGVEPDRAAMGRPACSVVPEAINTARGAVSLGCIGNRVYTELADSELYLAIPGPKLEAVSAKLVAIVQANQELETFHRGRQVAA
jgi:uncharacterized protein (DUF169 family)